MGFDKWTQSCERHYSDGKERLCDLPFCSQSPFYLWPLATAFLSSVVMTFPVVEFYVKGVRQCVVFSIWLFHWTWWFWDPPCHCRKQESAPFCCWWWSIVWISCRWFTQSPEDGPLDCFQFLSDINETWDEHLHTNLWVDKCQYFFWVTPKSGTVGSWSYGKFMLTFIRKG